MRPPVVRTTYASRSTVTPPIPSRPLIMAPKKQNQAFPCSSKIKNKTCRLAPFFLRRALKILGRKTMMRPQVLDRRSAPNCPALSCSKQKHKYPACGCPLLLRWTLTNLGRTIVMRPPVVRTPNASRSSFAPPVPSRPLRTAPKTKSSFLLSHKNKQNKTGRLAPFF